MIKITTTFSKKVPGKEQYSMLEWSASVEREFPGDSTDLQLEEKRSKDYKLLEHSVNQEEAQYRANENGTTVQATPVTSNVTTDNVMPPTDQQPAPAPQQQNGNGNTNGNSNKNGNWPVSENQLNWINNLIAGRSEIRSLSNEEVVQELFDVCNIRCTENNVKETLNTLKWQQASKLIKSLKAKEKVS